MHLCLVSNEYPPAKHGGIGSCNYDLAEGMAQAGHRVTVVGMYSQKEIDRVTQLGERHHENIRVVRLPLSAHRLPHKLFSLWNRKRLKSWIAKTHSSEVPFDLLEFSDYDGWLPWGGPAGLPSVVRLHGSNLFFDSELGRKGNSFEYGLERKTLKSADSWLGVSRFAFDRTLRCCDLNQWAGGVIHNAVDTEFFSPDPATPVERGLIVFVNSINPKKGVEELMQAANILLPAEPNAHLVVIGSDGGKKDERGHSYTDRLKSMLRPEIAGRVLFPGRLDRHRGVLPYLRKAHVCCYPSHSETCGIAPLEAMSVGRPTVFSTCGPGPELIEQGVSGLLCDPRDPRDIAEKLRIVLTDSEKAERYGREGRARVLKHFNKSLWIAQNVAFFEEQIRQFRTAR